MMTVIYITFGIVFGLVILSAVILGGAQISVHNKLKKIEESKGEIPVQVVSGENVAIRVRDAKLTVSTSAAKAEKAAPAAPAAPVAPVAEKEEPAEGTFLPRAEKLSFEEKMAQLSPETLLLLGAFRDYISSQPECEQLQQANAICFRYHKSQIAKAVIRRDSVILNFAIVNPNLGRMVREDGSSGLKLKPVEIRLADSESLDVAKQTADLTIGYLKQEEEYRAEKRKEARREAARKKREEAEN